MRGTGACDRRRVAWRMLHRIEPWHNVAISSAKLVGSLRASRSDDWLRVTALPPAAQEARRPVPEGVAYRHRR